jgi:alpha-tubulin suppressor-like RCC1 family protein
MKPTRIGLLPLSGLFALMGATGCGSVSEGQNGVDAGLETDASSSQGLAIAISELPEGNVDAPYEAALEATGGTPPYAWSATGLAPGLGVDSEGLITGTPTEAGAYDPVITVTDDTGATAQVTLSLEIANDPVILTESLPALHVFRRYEAQIEVAGGTPPFEFEAAGLPSGLVIQDDSGAIRNDFFEPAIAEATPRLVTITVTDDAGAIATAELSLDIIAIASLGTGGHHQCAIDDEGAAWCWGANPFGQLGNEEVDEGGSGVPVPVQGGHVFTSIAAGFGHTCAIDDEARGWCWGRNFNGLLGNDDAGNDSPVPVEVAGGHAFAVIVGGDGHTCALDDEGAAWCWGSNNDGRLGNNDEGNHSAVPAAVAGNHTFKAIAVGAFHTCAVRDDGDAYCWGRSNEGQLGNNTTSPNRPAPVAVVGGHEFQSITAGTRHTCAVDESRDAWCWGEAFNGQLGNGQDGSGNNSPVPVKVLGNRSFQLVAGGASHTCGILVDDSAWCWGRNDSGQIGNGESGNTNSVVPEPVNGGLEVSQLGAGESFNCVLAADGVVWCWGSNGSSQLGNGRISNSFEPIAVHPEAL